MTMNRASIPMQIKRKPSKKPHVLKQFVKKAKGGTLKRGSKGRKR